MKVARPFAVEPNGKWHKMTVIDEFEQHWEMPPCVTPIVLATLKLTSSLLREEDGFIACELCVLVSKIEGPVRTQETRNTRDRMWYAVRQLRDYGARQNRGTDPARALSRARASELAAHYRLDDVHAFLFKNESDAMRGFRRMYVAKVVPNKGVVTGNNVRIIPDVKPAPSNPWRF
jgi:hypothetical protein